NHRAIFYDYDELALVRDCRFKRLPKARSDEEEMHHGAWFYVDPSDVFPEEFPRFLGLTAVQTGALLRARWAIFGVDWWLALHDSLRRGDAEEVMPYPDSVRLIAGPAAHRAGARAAG